MQVRRLNGSRLTLTTSTFLHSKAMTHACDLKAGSYLHYNQMVMQIYKRAAS